MNEPNGTKLYFVKRVRLFRTGIQDIYIIGAVAADSPVEALDVAYEFFPWKVNDEIRVRAATKSLEVETATKWARERVRSNWEFRAWMTMPVYDGELA